MKWISLGILVVQGVLALLTYQRVYRHRSVYGIKTAVLRMPRGTKDDIHALDTSHIDAMLSDGRHTVLQVVERQDKDLEFIIGVVG